jgi:ankyrin repeat protein
LHFAAFFNRPEIALQLISRGSDVNVASKNAMKVTPLHSAAAAHSDEIGRLLLEEGANADARQQGGWTALHAAAQNGDLEMVRDLLRHQADPLARNDEGKTAADIAAEKGHAKVVELLSK